MLSVHYAIQKQTQGVDYLSDNRYSVDEDFFKSWTRGSAWVYGWILTDGSVSEQSGQISLMLKSIDKDVLEKIKHTMKFSGHIYDRISSDGRTSSSLRICRKSLCEDLFTIGLARKHKTFNTSLPNVPCEVFWDLMRGIFEGDGNLKHGMRWNDLTITIASATKDFLTGIQRKLSSEFGIHTRMYTRKIGVSGCKNEVYTLISKSNADALRWCFFMYKNTDSSMRLDRKFEVFRKYVAGYYDRNRRSVACISTIEAIKGALPECSDVLHLVHAS